MDKITRKFREQNETGFKEEWKKLKIYLNKKRDLKNIGWNLDNF